MRGEFVKPGDFIEWVYKNNGKNVHPQEELLSSTMRRWVPIGGINLLISFAEGVMTWLPVGREKRLFHAHVDDMWSRTPATSAAAVIPRARG